MARSEHEPSLPIGLTPVSNGEFDPPALTSFTREVVRRAREAVDRNARRTGMSRRQFLISSCGAATTLAVLSACSSEQQQATTGTDPGGTFTIPDAATTEPQAADEVLDGDQFVFDVQSHLLEYPPGASDTPPGFPQSDCGDDPRECFDIEHYLDLIFNQSATNMAVLSAIPFGGGVLSPEVMATTIATVDRMCDESRVLMQGETSPSVGAIGDELDAMAQLATDYPIQAWKAYTHAGGPGWFLDDHDPDAPQVGAPFLNQAASLGIPRVAVHKGLSGNNPFASPVDIGPAALAHPDLSIIVYHSGYEGGTIEGPYQADGEPEGVDRLIRSVLDAGIGPNGRVYAELGTTWRSVMGRPDEAAHLIGKLLVHMGGDNVMWGTDSIWYGAPQDQIEAFTTFEISEQFQEQFGYPALTDELRAKIFGLNSAALYGIEPVTGSCELDRDALAEARQASPDPFASYGPTTLRAARELQAAGPPWLW